MIALLSVADKTNLVPFARGLHARGWRLRASGGTAAALRQAGLPVEDVAAVTGHPEILGGRVKTLHPAVHAGILTRRTPEDAAALAALGYAPIDLVAVNLYPFRQTVAAGAPEAEVLEQIDIGGPALLRAAAKSFPHVWAVCDPADYDAVLAALDAPAEAGHALRRRLAAKAFAHTAAYDAVIAAYLADEAPWPPLWLAAPARRAVLRYGENPDQRAAWYTDPGPGLRLRHEGAKGLSYNNLLDLDAAWLAASQWTPAEGVVCAVVKHGTPCGIGLGATATEALERAWACDPTSAYGGILAWNAPLDGDAARALQGRFVEVVAAPAFADEALAALRTKPNLRAVELPGPYPTTGVEAHALAVGWLLQDRPSPVDERSWRVATARAPTPAEWAALRFAWRAAVAAKSNAVVLAFADRTVGVGAGQTSRIDAVHQALAKARAFGHPLTGAALASDAFFPFPDAIEALAGTGVSAVVQPAGAKREAEVLAAAEAAGLAVVLVPQRRFRH